MNIQIPFNYLMNKKMKKAMGRQLAIQIATGRNLIKIIQKNYPSKINE